MKKEYLDHYGIDSLPHLKIASENRCECFVTSNKRLLADRQELEEAFGIRIRTPQELIEEEK